MDVAVLRSIRDRFALEPSKEEFLGKNLQEDLVFLNRFRRCKKRDVVWRAPSAEERLRWDEHPILDRYAQGTDWIAEVDGRVWMVRSRLFHGWPDPPEWVFFAMEEDKVWAAGDFDWWPRRWINPTETGPAT